VKTRRLCLRRFPVGMPQEEDFDLEEADLQPLRDGEIIVRTIYLSLDPYMRGRMTGIRSYADPARIGEPVPGQVVGQVVASRSERFPEGCYVTAYSGWQTYAVHPEIGGAGPVWGGLRRVDPELAPLSAFLGVLGMPGLTAYAGVVAMADLKRGETLFVSAASGAVGSVAGQIARLRGARVVGVAGSPEKCAYVRDELGFSACFSHREDLARGFRAHAPNGVDVNFENVGGDVFWACYDAMNVNGRIIVCGSVSGYNSTGPGEGPDRSAMLIGGLIPKRLTLRGLLVGDWMHLREEFLREVGGWVRQGEIRYREDIRQGLETAVSSFQGLLSGRNFGKMLVQMGPDPTR